MVTNLRQYREKWIAASLLSGLPQTYREACGYPLLSLFFVCFYFFYTIPWMCNNKIYIPLYP